MTNIHTKIKPPKNLGGFFILITISLLLYSNVFAKSSDNVSLWVKTDYQNECKILLENNSADIKYYSNWLKSFYINIDKKQIETLKKSKLITNLRNASNLQIPELEYDAISLLKVLVDENNLWFENFSDSYYKQYLLSKQIHLLNYFDLEKLPKVNIGVIDGGFEVKDDFFNNITVKANRNFTEEEFSTVNNRHGTSVLGLLAGSGKKIVKTAGNFCNFYLAKTEVHSSEKAIEEYYLVSALEWMVDTAKVELINISLGYSLFDEYEENHKYTEFTGDSTIAAKAVNIAYKKGTVIFTSAGNEGNENNPWQYITTPADAYGVLAVGSVRYDKDKSPFSSIGIDGFAIKPDIMDIGSDVTVFNIEDNNIYAKSQGTSLASPIALGTAILLKRLNPNITNKEIYSRLRKSGDNYSTPNYYYGYGIINSLKAISDSTTLCGFIYDDQKTPINNCKIKIDGDSVFTKQDGFWFYKSNTLKNANDITIFKNGFSPLKRSLAWGSIDSAVITQIPQKSVKIGISSYQRAISKYVITGKDFSYTDYSNYNGNYLLDTNNVLQVIQITKLSSNDSNTLILKAPFKDTVTQINSNNYYAKISFLQKALNNEKYLDNIEISVLSNDGNNQNYTTDEYGSIFLSSQEIGDYFSVSINSKQYMANTKNYQFVEHIIDTIYTSIKPTIYPNPLVSGNTIFVNYKNIVIDDEKMWKYAKVYTSLGKKVKQVKIEYDIDNDRFVFTFGKLSAGVYYIKIEENTYKFLYIK